MYKISDFVGAWIEAILKPWSPKKSSISKKPTSPTVQDLSDNNTDGSGELTTDPQWCNIDTPTDAQDPTCDEGDLEDYNTTDDNDSDEEVLLEDIMPDSLALEHTMPSHVGIVPTMVAQVNIPTFAP